MLRGVGRVVGGGGHQKLDLVIALQQQGAEFRAQGNHAFAHLVQQGFDVVGEFNHLVQTKNSRRPLDGVGTPKQRVQQFPVVGLLFQLQQQGFNGLGLLHRFADEGRHGRGDEILVRVVTRIAHGGAPQASDFK